MPWSIGNGSPKHNLKNNFNNIHFNFRMMIDDNKIAHIFILYILRQFNDFFGLLKNVIEKRKYTFRNSYDHTALVDQVQDL